MKMNLHFHSVSWISLSCDLTFGACARQNNLDLWWPTGRTVRMVGSFAGCHQNLTQSPLSAAKNTLRLRWLRKAESQQGKRLLWRISRNRINVWCQICQHVIHIEPPENWITKHSGAEHNLISRFSKCDTQPNNLTELLWAHSRLVRTEQKHVRVEGKNRRKHWAEPDQKEEKEEEEK